MSITSVATRVFEWLGLRPGERRETAFGFTALLLVITGHAMLETARDSLFLSELPVERLPWAYLTIALLALVAGRVFNARIIRWPRVRSLTVALVGGAVVDIVFWQLCADRRPSILFALYVWTGLIATLVTLQLWLLAGDVLDVGRAKRVFAIIGAGGLAGATLGSALAGLVVMVAPPRTLILGSAVLFGVAALVTRWWARGHGTTRAHPLDAAVEAPSNGRASLGRDPYLGRILLVTVLATVVVTGVDYLFKASVAANVPKQDLPHFFARYQTIVNGCALVFQLLVAPRMLQGLGVVPALSFLPAIMLFGMAATAVGGGLAPALLVKAADGTMRHSLDRAGQEILYLPLTDAVRERFRALTTSLGQRGGQALASVAILFAGAAGASPRQMAIGLTLLSAGWLATLASLRGHYIGRFREQLRALSRGAQGSLPPLDVRSLEVLVAALSSADEAEVLAAIDMLEAYGKRDLVSPLLVHHPSRAVTLRTLTLFADTPRPEVLQIVERLLVHDDGEVRAAALRMCIAHAPEEALLHRHLRDRHPAVRCTALVGLVAGGFVDDENRAIVALRQALEHATPDSGPILASALHDLPPRFASLLASELSRNDDPRFGAEVAKAIADDPSPVFLETLIELLARREARVPAREALVGLGAVALDRLAKALADPATPRAIRLHVPRSISRFGTARAAAILVERLAAETDDRVTYKILRGLGRLRTDDPSLPVDEDAMWAVAEAQIGRAVTVLAVRLACGALAHHAPRGNARLLPDLLEEKERRAVEAVFRVLHVLEPTAGYAVAYRGLASADAVMRANGRELAENLLRGRLRAPILALTDTLAPTARLEAALGAYAPPGTRALLEVIDGDVPPMPDDVPRLHAMACELAASALFAPNDVVHAIMRRELDVFGWSVDANRRVEGADRA